MLLLFAAWLLAFALCASLGLLVFTGLMRIGGRRFAVVPGPFRLFWLGLALLIAELQLISLVMPVGGLALALILASAVAGVVTLPPVLRAWRRAAVAWGATSAVVYLLGFLVVAFVVGYTATGDVTWSDTVSTHLEQEKWMLSYRAVPGLANLSTKLGFDQAYHLVAALFDHGPLRDRTTHAALGFLLTATLAQWLWILVGPARTLCEQRGRWFAALTLPFLAGKALFYEVASLSGDLAMACVALAVALELVMLPDFDRRDAPRARRGAPFAVFMLCSLGALLVCIKLSGLGMLVAVGGAVFVAYRRRRTKPFALFLFLPLVLALGFCARRAILTGWLFYPIPFGNLHLPWSVPAARVVDEYNWIKSWARLPRVAWPDVLGMGFFHWFHPWFEIFRTSHAYVLLVAGCCLLAARLCARGALSLGERCVLVAGGSSLLYWFAGAPDLRFGEVFFWIFFAAAAVAFLASMREPSSLVVVLSVALMSWNGGFDLRLPRAPRWTELDPAPKVPLKNIDLPQADGSVLKVWTPKTGDQCGDAPLPCTVQPGQQQMRVPGRLSSGFLPK